jgi:hypothetical protein
MSEVVSLEPSRKRALRSGECIRIVGNAHLQKEHNNNFFNRQELNAILQVYSRHVMTGEWLDYAIGEDPVHGAVFEIYGQVAPLPLFRVYKRLKANARQGRYQVADKHRVLATAKTLEAVLNAARAFLEPVLSGNPNRTWNPESWIWE